MNYIDYILLAFILIGFILGYKDGLIRKVLGVAGLITAIVLAASYYNELGEKLVPMFNNELYLAKVVSAIVIFLGTIFLVSIIKRMVQPADKVSKFINNFLGGLIGIIQIVFILSVFMLILNILNFPNEEDQDESMLYSSVYSVLPITIEMFAGDDFKTEGFLKDYIKSKNEPTTTEIPPIEKKMDETDSDSDKNELVIPNGPSVSLDSLINN